MLLIPTAALAATLTVPGDYPTIEQAVKHASAGDSIELAAGDYTEDLSLSTDLSLVAPDGATIVGTHDIVGAEVHLEGITFTGSDTYRTGLHVEGAVLTVRDCSFVDNRTTYGDTGALYAHESELLIQDSVFERNLGFNLAGGVYAEGGSVELDGVSFRESNSTYGHSALYAKDADVVLRSCSFTDLKGYTGAGAVTVEGSVDLVGEGLVFEQVSTTYGSGGALYFKGDGVLLTDVVVQDSQGYNSGGALYLEADEVEVSGLRVLGADCVYGQGGGLYVKADQVLLEGLWIEDASCSMAGGVYLEASSAEVLRSVFLGGTAVYGQGAGHLIADELDLHDNDWLDGGELALQSDRGRFINSIVSTSAVSFLGVELLGYNAWSGSAEPQPGEGDLEGECGFVSYPTDLHLADDSPCIDAGHPELLDEDGGRSDIGAFGPYVEPVDTADSGLETGLEPQDSADGDDSGDPLLGRGSGIQPFCGCSDRGGSAALFVLAGLLMLRRRR
jgi:hypothetical protein